MYYVGTCVLVLTPVATLINCSTAFSNYSEPMDITIIELNLKVNS